MNLNLIIGGKKLKGSSELIKKISPIDESVISEIYSASPAEVEQAILEAKKNLKSWSSLSSIQRGDILFKIADILKRDSDKIAEVVKQETGKSKKDALGEISAAIEQARFMAGEGHRMQGKVLPGRAPGKMLLVTRVPVGVCALIVSSNTPVANFAWKVFPALICGNTCVIKSSEDTPATTQILTDLSQEAGVPEGVLNLLHGGATTGNTLISHPNVQLISFTGSTEVGRLIEKNASGQLKKIFLELGGKNPLVICEDADLDNAIKWSLLSSFSNAGQRCASSSRILVHESIINKFTEMFLDKTNTLKIGSEDTDDLGPVINQKSFDRIMNAIAQAHSEGANILCGGKRFGSKGYFIKPTIISNVKMGSHISQKELFGPITCVYSFKDIDHAIELANGTDYGLTASIHTRDMNKALKFANSVDAGLVNFNIGTHGSEPHFPFGGFKGSGNGLREPGTEALEVYSSIKNISLNPVL